MRYAQMNRIPSYQERTDTFLGYNHHLRARNGEFYDMTNMTGKLYPLLSPRQQRGTYKEVENPQGLIAKGSLVYVDGASIVINGVAVDMGLSILDEDCPKDLVGMGGYIIIMPDKKYINTMDIEDRGNIESFWKASADTTFELSTLAGAKITPKAAAEAPVSPKNGDYWIDTSEEKHSLKRYSEATQQWVQIPTTYVKISSAGIGKGFKKGDGVSIKGIIDPSIQDLNASMVIQELADDWILVIGLLDNTITQTIAQGAIDIARRMPKMDFITEARNRLWGCRYGTNNAGKVVNELYCSKLGDFKNWEVFSGASTDSYIVSIGSDGPFTAAVTHKGSPVFYKEAVKHKVFGDYPAAFGVVTTECSGVGPGNSRSVAMVNDCLYYMSNNAVCRDDGSLPVEVSWPLGEETRYKNGVGGSYGSLYILSCQDADDNWHLFVNDTAKRLWHRQDNTHAMAIQAFHDDVYYIDADTKKIRTMFGTGVLDTDPVEWMAETGLIAVDDPGSKYISKLDIRMQLDVGTRVRVFCQYDSVGDWECLATMAASTLRTFSSVIRPKRCDHLRLRIKGVGPARIYSIARTIERGSY